MPRGLSQRVLEPEAMDDPAEADDYDRMDHAAVNRRFVDDLIAAGPDLSLVLDLGAGTAQIPILLCQVAPGACVEAADAAEAMLDVARRNVERAGLAGRVRLVKVDAKGLAAADDAYSAVMSNSLVHHLPDARPALAEALRVARPGALLFFRDLFRPADEAELDRLVATHAAGADERQRTLFANSLRAAYTVDEMRALVGELGFPPESVRATSDRHWTWIARKAEA